MLHIFSNFKSPVKSIHACIVSALLKLGLMT